MSFFLVFVKDGVVPVPVDPKPPVLPADATDYFRKLGDIVA